MASWKIVSRKMAALQMAIAVIGLAALALGGLVPFLAVVLYMHSYVHAFLLGMAFCIACTAETYAYPNARSQSSDGFNWQQARIPCLDSAGSKSGSQTCAQLAVSMDSIWIPHLCSTGNWQLAIGNRQQVCIPYPSIQPVFHRYQSGRRIVVHSATVRRPDNAGEGTQSQEKRSRICSAVP